jgi:hypothetical protein
MKIIKKELLSEIKKGKAIEEHDGGLSFKLHETSYFYCRYHGRGHNTEACPET